MSENEKVMTRNQHIDSMRGIAVLLVIIGHCWTFQEQFISKLILAFHMPLFFFIAGYLFNYTETYNRNSISVIISKFNHLLIPYFAFEGINVILSLIVRPHYGNLIHESVVIQSILLCLNTPEYEGISLRLWFLPAAFVSSIYLLLICKLKKYYAINIRNFYLYVAFAAFGFEFFFSKVIFQRLPFTMDISIMATAYMLLGFSFKNHIDVIGCFQKWKAYGVGLIAFGILLICTKLNSGYFKMFLNSYGSFGFAVIGSIAGIIVIFELVYCFDIKNRFLIWLGENSLVIFPLHLEILFFLRWMVEDYFPENLWQYAFFIYFPICLICLFLLVTVIKKYCPVLIGKSKIGFHSFQKYR